MSAPFLGKSALSTYFDTTTAVTLGESGAMCMSPLGSSPSDEQRINLYGDLNSKIAFQAANGKYLVWDGGGWSATGTAAEAAMTFEMVVERGDGTFGIRDDGVNGQIPYFFADGSRLYGEFADGFDDPPQEMGGSFSRNEISPGLAELLSAGGRGLDLRWVNFFGVDFSGIRLPECDFSYADFCGVLLAKAVLSKATLKDIIFDAQTVFTDCQLDGADLSGLNLAEVNFSGTNLRGAILSKAILRGVVLDTNTILKDAQLDAVDLTGTTVEKVDFSGVNLRGATLNQATFHQVDFVGANLTGVSAIGGGEGVSFAGCDLSNSVLENAKLKGARFAAEAGLPAAVMANCYMPNANLTSANLVAVDMPGVQWYGSDAEADGADLTDSNLSKANLATMDLSQVKLDGIVLSYANLVNTDLRGASLQQSAHAASLAFASLQGADLTRANLSDADLTNAAVALTINGPGETFVGVPIFDITDTSLTSDLDSAQVTTTLINAFTGAGYPLIDKAAITVVGAGHQWSIDNYDKSGSILQSAYGAFSLVLRTGPDTIRVYGSPPLLVIAYNSANEQIQKVTGFTETVGLLDALDDDTTCPNGMRWSQRNNGVEVETLMTAAEPPHPPACVPSEDNWCFTR